VPPPPFDQITIIPALYGILNGTRIPDSDISPDWDKLIAPILDSAEMLYDLAHRAFTATEEIGAAYGFQVFLHLIKGMASRDSVQGVPEEVLEAVFLVHWELFMVNGGNRIPHEEAKRQWANDNVHKVEWCKGRLKRCLIMS
jgi:hypothetical protein